MSRRTAAAHTGAAHPASPRGEEESGCRTSAIIEEGRALELFMYTFSEHDRREFLHNANGGGGDTSGITPS